MHHARIRGSGDSWLTVLPAELGAIESGLVSLVNGVDGGTWAPTSQVIIGGSGLHVTGPFAVTNGGALEATNISGFSCQDNDYPELGPTHSARSRDIAYGAMNGRGFPQQASWRARWTDGGMQSIAPSIDISDGKGPQTARLWVPIRCHNGATLSGVSVRFRIGFPHTQLPQKAPSARVVRVNAQGQITPLTSIAAGGDASGYVYASLPTAIASWTGNQSIGITCDQNNVVDVSQYEYYVEFVEEQGVTGYPWSIVFKQPVKLAGNLTVSSFGTTIFPQALGTGGFAGGDLQPGAFVDGDRILLTNPAIFGGATVGIFGGIWIAHAGAWTRATDLQASTDFSQGMVVPVDQGGQCGASYWQCQTTITSWSVGSQPAGTNPFNSIVNYVVGNTVFPTHPNGYYYQCTTASGVAAGTEPAWTINVGATVTDGSGNVWKCIGLTTTSLAFVPPGPDDDETAQNAGTQFFAHGNIVDAVVASFTGIASCAFQ